MTEEKKKENGLANLIINIVLPAMILMKGAKYLSTLNSTQVLLLALAFPFFYGLYDFVIRKEKNFIPILGFVSILLSGLVGILELSREYIAIKEAAIPFIIGCVIIVSNYTSFPIAPKFLYNGDIFNKEVINNNLTDQGKTELDERIKKASIYLFFSFMLSAFLNFIVAKYFIVSKTGTPAFNDELGQMTLWSYPIIVLPTMVLMIGIIRYIYVSIKNLTGLTSDDIFLLK
jgi:hypothetical protein